MTLNNTYYILRHGQAVSNTQNTISCWPETFENPLTQQGRQSIEQAAESLQDKHIDMIFSSDLLRVRQSAQIVGQALNIEPEFDIRLREINFGTLNGRPIAEWDGWFKKEGDRFSQAVPGGETYRDVAQRVIDFFDDINATYQDKHILIVGHELPLWILEGYTKGWTLEESFQNIPPSQRLKNGQVKKLT